MPGLRELFMQLQINGLEGTLRILRYTLHRDRLDARYAAARSHQPASRRGEAQSPGLLQKVEPLPDGAALDFDRARLEVRFLAPEVVCYTWVLGRPPVPYALTGTQWPGAAVEVVFESGQAALNSQSISLYIGDEGKLEFYDTRPAPSTQVHAAPLRTVRQTLFSHTGPQVDALNSQEVAAIEGEERLYGLGERAGRLNWRGETHRLWNSDPYGSYQPGDDPLYMPLPVYLGLHAGGSYLIFYENYHPATISSTGPAGEMGLAVKDGKAGPAEVSPSSPSVVAAFEGGQLRAYFFLGPIPQAIQRFTELTGRAPLPPRWALGYHQSRWSYKSASEVRQVARGFAARELPLSAIHLDIDYMQAFRVFTVDPQRFPDLAGLAQELSEMGIRLVTILDPGVKQDPDYFMYQEGLEQGVFATEPDGSPLLGIVWPGWSAFPDFTNPQTRTWWAAQYPRLLSQGIAGIWHDMNEPTSFAAWNGPYLPKDTRHAMEGQGGNHLQAHNLYALLMARAGFEGLRQAAPERRPWIVSRAGWVSIARYAWNWTGDSHTSWDSLRMVASIVMSCGLCGQPYNGPDIGGFSGDPDAELYLRWFQMAAFLPFFRTHSAFNTARREPWSFGEPYTSIIRQFLRLRSRLMPYFYSLAWQASQTGYPLVRPLFWLDPSDPRLWDRDDAFLLGDGLLVAPLLEQNVKKRQVQLPPGGWYDFWDDTLHQGPGQVEIETGLEHIPLLVQSGSLIPLEDGDRLELHIYAPIATSPGSQAAVEATTAAGSAAEMALYSDAGDGYEASRIDYFSLRRNEDGRLIVDWRGEGDFPFPYSRVELILHGAPGRIDWGPAGKPAKP